MACKSIRGYCKAERTSGHFANAVRDIHLFTSGNGQSVRGTGRFPAPLYEPCHKMRITFSALSAAGGER